MTPRKGYYKDLTGRKFGLWTVLSFHKKEPGKHSVWLCQCQCGTVRPVVQPNLVGEGGSCGCNCGNWMTPLRKGWIENGIGYLPLTRDQVAMVSPHRVEELSQWHWQAAVFNGKFYAHRWAMDENGNRYRLHLARYILGMPRSDRREADHIDNDATLDNRDENLRPVTRHQSMWNKKVRKDSRTGVKGVFLNGAKTGAIYSSKISCEGVRVALGSSYTLEEGARKYMPKPPTNCMVSLEELSKRGIAPCH